MDRKLHGVFGATSALLCGLCLVGAASAQNHSRVIDAHFLTAMPGQAAAPPQASADDIAKAKDLVNEHACLGCHRVEKRGMYMGPSLNGVGARRTPDAIKAAIQHPHPELSPANYMVTFTTADGKTAAGRILSQNDHEIKLISMTGEVATYPKQGIKDYTENKKNPMPSYDGNIEADDLNSLVRYLASLPALDETAK